MKGRSKDSIVVQGLDSETIRRFKVLTQNGFDSRFEIKNAIDQAFDRFMESMKQWA